MTLLKRLLILREAREKRDAQSLRRASDAHVQAGHALDTAQRTLEQGLLDTRRQGDALFNGMQGGLWTLAAVQGMHGKLKSLAQDADTLRAGVVDAQAQCQQSQSLLEASQAVLRRSQNQVGKTKEMHTLHEREALARREHKEELEMEEIGATRRPAS
ncbi:YscO family type III secretion system apparatus protein [Bordetella sp. N]|uniref:type III secretion system stalk subunit SctO n=1 Tax=Bordetella sp. N TaxID=1746199 RepID=UPI00070E9B33|nr:YscO family type III secretion system apparatus protein [Bordetella sp. N]ALM86427.1 hypothetical protein ASB57_28950 [Bordetella sp. N]